MTEKELKTIRFEELFRRASARYARDKANWAKYQTGDGLHGKDLSKADVSVNIYAWIKAQTMGETVELYCAIGDETVDGLPYSEIVDCARRYIEKLGGFEKFAEWGLIR